MRIHCSWVLALLLLGCASGPHPTIKLAAQDLECPEKDLEAIEIFPKKYRVEGCDKEMIYIHGCDGYGADAECRWVKKP